MPRTSRKRLIKKRLVELKKAIKIDTQRLRVKMLNGLEELFDLATAFAEGKIKTQVEEGKKVKVTLKQRQMWARVAAYIAQIMNSLAEGFDEREIDAQLEELERLVNEAKAKTETRRTKEKAQGTKKS